jgi:hypothetical protein
MREAPSEVRGDDAISTPRPGECCGLLRLSLRFAMGCCATLSLPRYDMSGRPLTTDH